MMKRSNELTNVSESTISKLLKKISNFFRRKESINKKITDKNSNNTNEISQNKFKADLTAEYNELQRLNIIREQYQKDESYINHIDTEDLIKLTEMNKRETREIENQIKRIKATT